MAIEELYNELLQTEELTAERILNTLLRADENLNLKTHIENPIALAILTVMAERLQRMKLKKSSQTLRRFIRVYLEYMVSYKRLSRKEIIDALKERRREEEDETKLKRLLGIT